MVLRGGKYNVKDYRKNKDMVWIIFNSNRNRYGCLSFHDEAEDVEEQPLVRNTSTHTFSGSAGLAKDVELVEATTLPNTATMISAWITNSRAI